jgi:hypothetical protein
MSISGRPVTRYAHSVLSGAPVWATVIVAGVVQYVALWSSLDESYMANRAITMQTCCVRFSHKYAKM